MKKLFLLLISSLLSVAVLASTPPKKIPSGSRAQRMVFSTRTDPGFNQSSGHSYAPPMKEKEENEEQEEEMVMVNFSFNYNAEEYSLAGLNLYFTDPIFGDMQCTQIDESSPHTYLPNWLPVTMVCTFSYIFDDMVPVHTYIVKEDVMVEEGMDIVFNPDDAVNEIEFTSYYPNGTKCVLPQLYVNPRTGDEEWDMTGANTYYIWYDCILYIDGIGPNSCYISGGSSYIDRTSGISGERLFNCRINDVSDKVHFLQSRYIVPWDGETYFELGYGKEYVLVPLESRGSEVKEINNLGTPSMTYELGENMVNTPNFNIEDCIAHTEKISPVYIRNNRFSGFIFNLQTIGDNPKVTLFEPSIENPVLQVGASVAMIEKEEYNEYEELQQYGVFSLPLINNFGDLTYIATSALPNQVDFRPLKSWNDQGQFSPSYEAFDTPLDLSCKIGSSFPVNTTFIEEMRTEANNPVFVPNPTYIGMMGELRNIDILSMEATIEVDGEPVVESYDGYKKWLINRADEEHEKGTVSFTFTNRNYKLNDIDGNNYTVMAYDENNPEEDYFPPMLGMLRLIDTEGNVREYFKESENIILELTAGDFHSNRGRYFKQMPVSQVNVLVSPYGEFDFNPITITENPDKTSTTAGYGYFYESSPEGFGSLEKGAYDLMVMLEDANGNYTRQLISPAFVIGEPTKKVATAIEELSKGKVYNLSGTLVLDNADASDIDALSPGIYILHTDRGTIKRVVR